MTFSLGIRADDRSARRSHFSLSIMGGADSLIIGDINACLRAIDTNFYPPGYLAFSSDRLRGIRPLEGGWEAEIGFRLTKSLRLSVGTANGLHLGRRSDIRLFIYPNDPSSSESGTFSSNAAVQIRRPLKLSLGYSLPSNSRFGLELKVGVGVFSGKMGHSMNFDLDANGWTAWYRSQWETAWRGTIGFQSGLGIDFRLLNRFFVVAEAQYRLAKIDKFDAIMAADSNLWEHPRNYDPQGVLYLWAWGEDAPMGLGYEELMVWAGIPLDFTPRGGGAVRTASLDLSGFSIKIGIRIGLF